MDVMTTPARSAFAFALDAISQSHSLSHYLAATFPEADRQGLKTNLIASNWPLPLLDEYEAMDVFWDCRMVEELKRTIMPIVSDNGGFVRQGSKNREGELRGLFGESGLHHTIGFSLHDAQRRHYIVLFSGNGIPTADKDVGAIVYRTMKALDAYAAAVSRPGKVREIALTARELDCLRWSAAGKSSEEIALILNISIHTVNTHLKGAMRKLESVNRMQAVATACRLRLI